MKTIVYGLYDPRKCKIRYVGKTTKTEYERLDRHEYDAFRDDKRPVCRWIKKLIISNNDPLPIILEECESEQDALDLESIWIARLRSQEKKSKLLNITDGGDGISGYRHTKETKKKISEASRKQIWTKERKHKISVAISGEKNFHYGKPSPRKGVSLSEETKEKLKKANLGKKKPETSGNNHWIKRLNRESPMKGKHHSDKSKAKMSASLKGKKFFKRNGKSVICENDGRVFRSQQLAAEEYNLTKVEISRSCRLKKIYKGLSFKFADCNQ